MQVPAMCMPPVQEHRGKDATLQYYLTCKIVLWHDVFGSRECAAVKERNCKWGVFPCGENSQQLLDKCYLLPYQSLIQV